MISNLLDTRWIQAIQFYRTPYLDHFFVVCDFFDTIYFAAALVIFIWMMSNRQLACRVALFLILNTLLNQFFKLTFGMPRPYHIDPSLGILTDSSNGFPSGAAQNSILLCGILIKEWSHPIKWAVGPLYCVIICLSRIYLGLHFPLDILGGLCAGALLLRLYLRMPPLQTTVFESLKKES